MDGDKYYPYPHIYCHFDFSGEPYERKWFALMHDKDNGHPYFEQIATYEAVKQNDPEETLYFG